ncbi:MAG: DUF5658 family protein [Planctomycetota bacterium]
MDESFTRASAELRGLPDRRRRPTPAFSRYAFFGGRRHGSRRTGEVEGTFVDLYSRRLVLLLLVFFGLTLIDSVSTVAYLQIGGRELNPLARWLLAYGPRTFVVSKGIMTAALVLFAMLHKNFRYARWALGIGFGFYFFLAVYHLVLHIKAICCGGPVLA